MTLRILLPASFLLGACAVSTVGDDQALGGASAVGGDLPHSSGGASATLGGSGSATASGGAASAGGTASGGAASGGAASGGGSASGGGTASGGSTGTQSSGYLIDTVCYPACVSASEDDDSDGYGWNGTATCVVHGSTPALSGVSCVPGGSGGSPGTGGGTGMGGSGNVSHPGIFHPDTPGTCFPVCRAPYTGGESDGWGWYANYRSCVVLGSVPHQASTGACSWGRVSRGSCYALCTSPSVDPDNDGWGYENSASCIVSGSPADTSVDCVE